MGAAAGAPAGADNKNQEAMETEIPPITDEDVKVYLVDPRDKSPCLLELNDIYKEQILLQRAAVKRVGVIQKEMHKLLEDRMKELWANDMDVWIFDTKRNPQVIRGRREQEQLAKRKEESVMDLELDFLAPYLERYPDMNSLSKSQAIEVRDECLGHIRSGLLAKEEDLARQAESIKKELENKGLPPEDMKSKKFLLNVTNNRLKRQKEKGYQFYASAEQKIKSDPRLNKFFK